MKIRNASSYVVREKLKSPFGFKGHYIDELWQTVVMLEGENGFCCSCPGVQSPLWSDSGVFERFGPAESNRLMSEVTELALKKIRGKNVPRPDVLFTSESVGLFSDASLLCGMKVKPTFVLNALVGLDAALWMMWAHDQGIVQFEGIIPSYAKKSMSFRSEKLAHIPLISYGVGPAELRDILAGGTALLKIKIGNSPEGGDPDAMLEWDKRRLSEIHNAADGYLTDMTDDGHVKYYLDANGRYDTPERIGALLDHARDIGALRHIVLLEEPFAPDDRTDVSSLGVCVAADESAHSLEDVRERIGLGYRAVALKPAAKTFSVSFMMATAAYEAGAACFCADLTVNPLLVEWNRQFASRLEPLKGMRCGCLEVNGHQNYVRWEEMKKLLPHSVTYTEPQNGGFDAGAGFFDRCPLFERNGY